MTRAALLCLVLVGCTDDRSESIDALPKRGERSTDPTIVIARGDCGGTANQYIDLQVDASDPEGVTNLASCIFTLGGVTAEGAFYPSTTCFGRVETTCTPGASTVLEVTVSNATGGFTSATVAIVPQP